MMEFNLTAPITAAVIHEGHVHIDEMFGDVCFMGLSINADGFMVIGAHPHVLCAHEVFDMKKKFFQGQASPGLYAEAIRLSVPHDWHNVSVTVRVSNALKVWNTTGEDKACTVVLGDGVCSDVHIPLFLKSTTRHGQHPCTTGLTTIAAK
jgi:hypothetical protein